MPATSVDTEIQNIILEEAAPFFKGQKTVDEVARGYPEQSPDLCE